MIRSRGIRLLALVAALAVLVSACGGGPDLPAAMDRVDAVQDPSSAQELGVTSPDADRLWRADGTPTTVADAIAEVESPDERTDHADGDVFLLYKSGTLWLTPSTAAGETAVVYYDDNDRAYNRHSTVLIHNNRWGSRVNSYRSSGGGSSSGNGFRGGGSSFGK